MLDVTNFHLMGTSRPLQYKKNELLHIFNKNQTHLQTTLQEIWLIHPHLDHRIFVRRQYLMVAI
jgi:hypothetical protein